MFVESPRSAFINHGSGKADVANSSMKYDVKSAHKNAVDRLSISETQPKPSMSQALNDYRTELASNKPKKASFLTKARFAWHSKVGELNLRSQVNHMKGLHAQSVQYAKPSMSSHNDASEYATGFKAGEGPGYQAW